VGSKQQKRWVWVAICRRTREIIAFAIGDRRSQSGILCVEGIRAEDLELGEGEFPVA
jgi:IS1 family transposase